MKYLESYNENIKDDEVLQTLKEILYEINDLGISTTVNWTPLTLAMIEHPYSKNRRQPEILINIIVSKHLILGIIENYFVINECVERIKRYAEYVNWEVIYDESDIMLNKVKMLNMYINMNPIQIVLRKLKK